MMFYSLQQQCYINSLETDIPPDVIKEALADSWDITNHEEAIERLNYLRDKGYRFYQEAVINAFFSDTPEVKEMVILSKFSEVM